MTEGAISGTLEDGVPYTSAGQLLPNNEAKIVDLPTGKEMDHNEVSRMKRMGELHTGSHPFFLF